MEVEKGARLPQKRPEARCRYMPLYKCYMQQYNTIQTILSFRATHRGSDHRVLGTSRVLEDQLARLYLVQTQLGHLQPLIVPAGVPLRDLSPLGVK